MALAQLMHGLWRVLMLTDAAYYMSLFLEVMLGCRGDKGNNLFGSEKKP